MTWSVKIVNGTGKADDKQYHICYRCKHDQFCYLPKITSPLMSLITSVDTGADNHAAGGEALMKCLGFEEKQVE